MGQAVFAAQHEMRSGYPMCRAEPPRPSVLIVQIQWQLPLKIDRLACLRGLLGQN